MNQILIVTKSGALYAFEPIALTFMGYPEFAASIRCADDFAYQSGLEPLTPTDDMDELLSLYKLSYIHKSDNTLMLFYPTHLKLEDSLLVSNLFIHITTKLKHIKLADIEHQYTRTISTRERQIKIDALCACITKRNIYLVDALLTQGVRVNTPSSHGNTPIAIAAYLGYVDIFEQLYRRGADRPEGQEESEYLYALTKTHNRPEISQKMDEILSERPEARRTVGPVVLTGFFSNPTDAAHTQQSAPQPTSTPSPHKP